MGAAFFRFLGAACSSIADQQNNKSNPSKKRKRKTNPIIFICSFKAGLLFSTKRHSRNKPIIFICLFETWGWLSMVLIFVFWCREAKNQKPNNLFAFAWGRNIIFLCSFETWGWIELSFLQRLILIQLLLKQRRCDWVRSSSVTGFILYHMLFKLYIIWFNCKVVLGKDLHLESKCKMQFAIGF